MSSQSKERILDLNKREYGETYQLLRWVTSDEAAKASQERERILRSLSGRARSAFQDTKFYSGALSPGCLVCGAGSWSCLFINSLCNARCFYCPSEQSSRSEPTTNGMVFAHPQDYLDYLERFEFTGVSISGGEPFITFDKTLLFVSKIKRKFGSRMYVWVYTNGIAATREKLERLRDAGLDEIRFDISAHRYHLENLGMATDVIKTVTVEIPAIPEDEDRLRTLLSRLEEMGVKHLNLHDLRCTTHNCRHLMQRGYRFLHGAKVTVLDSELVALRLIDYAQDQGIEMPIHYCSFIYKERFQTSGHRKRLARFCSKPFESITGVGAIRRISLKAEPPEIERIVRRFEELGLDRGLWRVEGGAHVVLVHGLLFPHLITSQCSLFLSYYVPVLMPDVSYRFPFEEIALSRKRKVVIERHLALKEKKIERQILQSLLTGEDKTNPTRAPEKEREILPGELLQWEEVGWGLQEYF
jgi:pyruvate formate-lyase activating enzyme-like uncharacterized protein